MRPLPRWEVITDLIQVFGWTRGAELGVCKGVNYFNLLNLNPKLTLIGVDSWEESMGPPRPQDRERGIGDYNGAPLARWGHGVRECAKKYGERAIIMHERTTAAAEKIERYSLDFAFLDANHSEAGVVEDINNWFYKIKPGGAILGHDWDWGSVKRGVQSIFPREAIQLYDDNIWLVDVGVG